MADASPINWQSTLTAVEQSIADCLTALEKYETAFQHTLGEAIQERKPVVLPQIAAWDSKLAVATQHADDIERLLAEQDAIWQNWRGQFSAWQQLMQEAPPILQAVRRPANPHTN